MNILKNISLIVLLLVTSLMAAPVRDVFPNPNLAEGIRVIPEKFEGFGADLIFYPGSVWSMSWEDLIRKNQNTTDDDFNDWQGEVEFLEDGTAIVRRTHDGAGYILTMNVGVPVLMTYNDADVMKTFSTESLTSGEVIRLLLQTNQNTEWWSGNTNGGIGDANQFNSDHRVHAIISCVSGNCTGNSPSPVPEPATYAMIGIGLAGAFIFKRK